MGSTYTASGDLRHGPPTPYHASLNGSCARGDERTQVRAGSASHAQRPCSASSALRHGPPTTRSSRRKTMAGGPVEEELLVRAQLREVVDVVVEIQDSHSPPKIDPGG